MNTRRDFIGSAFAAGAVSLLPGCRTSSVGEPIRILHLGDPQFGFCDAADPEAAYRDCLARFRRMLAKIDVLKPDALVVSGDMCHKSEDLVRDWPSIVSGLDLPVAWVPGNHDLGDRVTAEKLAQFRTIFGRDCGSFVVKGWYFLVGNSQFWFPNELKDETCAYERWLDERLAEAREHEGRVIVATHFPLFNKTPEEPDAWNNCPSALRRNRLARYRAAGIRFQLAGHTHREAVRAARDLKIFNSETTSNNFDKRPFGGRLLTIRSDGTCDYEFVPVN